MQSPFFRPKLAKVLEVALPESTYQHQIRVRNNILIAQCIKNDGAKYVINVQCGADSSPTTICRVLSYISELYSVAWNEALSKKLRDVDILVLCEALKENNKGLSDVHQVLTELQSLPTAPHEPSSVCPTPVEVLTDDASRWEGCESHISVQDYNYNESIIELERGFMEHTTIFVAPETCLPANKYDFVALGGTFDHLHAGHKVLLTTAAALCAQELTIGITSPDMLTSKSHATLIDSFETRAALCRSLLTTLAPSLALDIHRLTDGFGPAVTKPELQALVVSSETVLGGFRINAVRIDQGMSPLHLLVLQRRDAFVMSSSFLRSLQQQQTVG